MGVEYPDVIWVFYEIPKRWRQPFLENIRQFKTLFLTQEHKYGKIIHRLNILINYRYPEVKYLVGESIEKIKKAEENARNQIAEAQAESERMLRDARAKAEEVVEEAKKQAAEEAKRIVEKAEEEAAQEIVLLKEKNEGAKENIRKTAGRNRAEAASFIIRRVIG